MPTNDTSGLIRIYEHGADELSAAIKGLTREQLHARPVPGKWSTMEVLCHLADSEQVSADRMKRIIAMDKPLLIGYDERLYAKKLAYDDRDPPEELELLRF